MGRWTYPHTGRSRRGLDEQVVTPVIRLARENPRRGYQRIVGEFRKSFSFDDGLTWKPNWYNGFTRLSH